MITLRIATCATCHSTVAVVPPADVGACPYCVAAPVVKKVPRVHVLWRWVAVWAAFWFAILTVARVTR